MNVLPAPVTGPELEPESLELEPHAATPSASAPQQKAASIDLREITSFDSFVVVRGSVPARLQTPVTGRWPTCEQPVKSRNVQRLHESAQRLGCAGEAVVGRRRRGSPRRRAR